MSSEIWFNPHADHRRFAAAFGIGLLLEAALLLLLMPYVAHHQPQPADQPAPVRLTIIAPMPTPPAPPPPKPVQTQPPVPVPPPPPPPPVPVVPPLPVPPTLLPLPHHIAVHRPVPQPRHVVAAPVEQPPLVVPAPTPPPPAAVAQAPSGGELAMFEAELHRAVQAALIFPDAAQMAHESGVVRLRFTYFNGAVSDITVIRSCGFPILDAAAVATARSAHYPPPPPDFTGRVETVEVEVVFPLAAPNVDSD